MGFVTKEISFIAEDGFKLNGAVFSAIGSSDNSNRVLIIGSAFGVPYQYYKHIAGFLAEQGMAVLVFDYRGISHSKHGNMSTNQILMQHWGQLDLEAAIQFVKKEYKPQM